MPPKPPPTFLPPKHTYASKLAEWARWCDRKHVEEPIGQSQFPEVGFLVTLLRSKRPLPMLVRKQIAAWISDKRFDRSKQGPDMDQIAKDLSSSKPVQTSVRQFLARELETGKLKLPRGRRPEINPFDDDLARSRVLEVYEEQRKVFDAEPKSPKPRDVSNRGKLKPILEKYQRTAIALGKQGGPHISGAKVRQIVEQHGKWKWKP